MRHIKFKKKIFCMVLAAVMLCFCLAACAAEPEQDALEEGFEAADMSAYKGLDGYDAPLQFVDITVADIDKLMNEKSTFVVFASFSDCPWCNAVVTHINDAALEADYKVGLLDTRKDPSWQSNLDIDDYDVFVKWFGEYLEQEEEGPHLYTPHIFFIKGGKVVYQHDGALPEMEDDPDMELTKEQSEELTNIFREGFHSIGA